jgi:branched-chain amino acid transport system substrate-binding protein
MHSIKTYACLGLCLAVCLTFISGCKTTSQEHPVAIGVNLALSGTGMSYGESTARGIELAKDQVNQSGGLLGQPVQLISVDNHGLPDDASAAARELSQQHVSVIIGPNMTECALAVIPETERNKIPVISPAGTHPDITVDSKTREVYRYMFRATFIDAYQGRAMADYAVRQLNGRTAAVMYDERSPYSRGLAEIFRKAFETDGGTVPIFLPLDSQDKNMANILLKLSEEPCDVVYAPFYDDQAVQCIDSLRAGGFQKPILGPDGWNGPKMAQAIQPAGQFRLYYSDHYANDVQHNESKKFIAMYYEKYGLLPDSYAALGYDSFMMAVEAIRRSQNGHPEDVAAELAKTVDFAGVTGTISLDANHDAVKDVYIMTFLQGEPSLLEKEQMVTL